jgi:predicted site-specific integrase-resolvase
LEQRGRRIEVVHLAENEREDLVANLVASVSSLCARLSGPRRAKRTTETIV